MLNVGFAIGIVGRPLTLQRRTSSFDATGDVSEGSPSDVNIVGSLQPISGETRNALPEGMRKDASAMLWTTTPLQAASPGNAGDRISFSGSTYEVIGPVDWSQPGGYQSYALKVVL